MNNEALDIALMVTLIVKATPVDEIHVMRKVVIDGSTPFGFQRTAVVALNGEIEVGTRIIPIQTVCVEEDACRKIKENSTTVNYRLDRLGIPLIEVVTEPVIKSPEEAEKVALAIGRIFRATGKVRRGLGTIRQDLNISIRGGALSEIKGVQDLELIPKVVEYEARRQLTLLEIRKQLRKKHIKQEDFRSPILDVTKIFSSTKSSVIRKAIQNGCRVMAINLPKFSGFLGIELIPKVRFGTELSNYAKFWGGVGGIFHSDELPAFGISDTEVQKLKQYTKANEKDAIVFVADKEENTVRALEAVVGRAKAAIRGIPDETRSVQSDGSTHFSRPRPGSARMYPETDMPPILITAKRLKRIKESIPEAPDIMRLHLMKNYGLNKKLANQVHNSDYYDLFIAVTSKTKISASFVAATLTETFKGLKREGIDLDLLSKNLIERVFILVDSRVVAKEAIPEILTWMLEHREVKLEDAVEALGMRMLSEKEVAAIVEGYVRKNEKLIKERGISALGLLMGAIMRELRGRADAEEVRQLIRKRVGEISA